MRAIPVVSATRIPTLTDNKADLIAATFTINDERLKQIDFSTVYFRTGQKILVKKTTTNINSVTDLNGKTVCTAKGSTSEQNVTKQAKDAKLLLLDTGKTEGTLGDPFLDRRFATEARECLSRGVSKTLFLEGIRCFVETFGPPSTLLVVGAGHVAMPLVSLAKIVGFKTIVVDGRPRFASRERFPDVDRLEVGIPSEIVKSIALTPVTALVLVAHDYKYDLPVLRHALASKAGYIGMLGSTRRGNAIVNLLREEGMPEDLLTRIRVPIGLDLGAQTAPEIALAILAEILAERTGATGMPISRKVREGKR